MNTACVNMNDREWDSMV